MANASSQASSISSALSSNKGSLNVKITQIESSKVNSSQSASSTQASSTNSALFSNKVNKKSSANVYTETDDCILSPELDLNEIYEMGKKMNFLKRINS